MDRHRYQHPNSSYHQKRHSAYQREEEDSGRGHYESKHFRPNHYRHHDQPRSAPRSNSLHSQCLSTRRELYERDFPVYKQPVEVGSFSLDSKRRFFNDTRQLRYYVEPDRTPNFDLKDGYKDRFIKRDDSIKEKLDHILRWILANRSKLRSKTTTDKSCALDVDFVTWRGHLTKLLTTPYEAREGWLLAVSLFRGTLYISEVETEVARRERENRTERHEEMMYWGYKFEQYTCAGDASPEQTFHSGIIHLAMQWPVGSLLLAAVDALGTENGGPYVTTQQSGTDDVHSSPDPGGVVNTNEAFCTVVQTRLADHRLVFSGEVDCRDKDPNAPGPPACYVELKTSAEICTPKQRSNFHRFKLIKWWAQSFLPGVPRVVAGFRDHDGVVVGVETFPIAKISHLIKNEQNCWKPTVCMNFCCDFLSFVKQTVTEDNPSVVYLFCYEPHRDVTYSIHRDSQYSFLPQWYVEEITRSQD